MEAQVKETIHACTKGSDEGAMSFPQVVEALSRAGVERYHADLQRSEKTYYLPSGESLSVSAHPTEAASADDFDPAGIASALRQIQARETNYRAFCAQIARAGCVGYVVSLKGRRAVYFGRTGETYVEPFPSVR